MIKLLRPVLFTTLILSNVAMSEEVISDKEKFLSYPYLEKAYRLQAENDYANAIEEIKKAIKIAPGYSSYQILLFEYLIADNQQEAALNVYQLLPSAAKDKLIARLIESQIKNDSLVLSEKLKLMLDQAPAAQREQLFTEVASRLIGAGQEVKVYHWLQDRDVKSIPLLTIKLTLADKLGKNADIQQIYESLNKDQRTPDLTRIYVLSLLKNDNIPTALGYANRNPKDPLSYDVYYRYLQTSIANNDHEAINSAFTWIASHYPLSPEIVEQKLEFAMQTNDRESAFAMLAQLNATCQKRIDLALFFDWSAKATDELIKCNNSMQKSTWIAYASSLLTTTEIKKFVLANIKYASELSELLIERHIANEDYPMAINEILRTKKQNNYIEKLAISYEKIGDMDEAIKFWKKFYLQSLSDITLDKVTFLQTQHNQEDSALALLEQRLLKNPTNMPSPLVTRLLSLYQANSRDVNDEVKNSLSKLNNHLDSVAELLRVYGSCDLAQEVLNKSTVSSSQSFQTRALCTAKSNQALALVYWQQAYKLNPSDDTLRSIAFTHEALGEIGAAIETLNQIEKSAWSKQDYLFAAQLSYQRRNYQDSEAYWELAKANNEAWLDFGTELAIQQQQYLKAQTLSQQLLVLKDDLTDQQWARQAIIYQRTDQPAKAARAWQIASEKSPQNSAFKLSWAYSLIDIQKDRAFKIMKEVINGNNMVDTRTLEQLGYLAAANQDHPAALEYITKSIVTESEDPLPRGEELSWLLHEYHRDLSEYWRFSAIASQGTGGILGDVFFIGNDGEQLAEPPTNNITARAEYYFNPLTEKWSIYGQVAGNGDDNRPLNDWSIELGVSYKPFDDFNFKGTLGAQRFFSGDWEGLIRINGDLLNQGKWRQDWRFEESWWERQLYFDFLWLPESDQFLGTVRADFGHAYSLETTSKQTIKYYGLAQYDTRKPQKAINGSTSFNQTSVGLGIQWRLFTTPNSPFKPVHRYSLALEWRYKVSGELTKDDNSLFLIANYLY